MSVDADGNLDRMERVWMLAWAGPIKPKNAPRGWLLMLQMRGEISRRPFPAGRENGATGPKRPWRETADPDRPPLNGLSSRGGRRHQRRSRSRGGQAAHLALDEMNDVAQRAEVSEFLVANRDLQDLLHEHHDLRHG